MGMVIKRFEVYLVNLDPTIGAEITKTRPCVIISPDEMNKHISTVIVALMTTKGRTYPTRVTCKFEDKTGHVVRTAFETCGTLLQLQLNMAEIAGVHHAMPTDSMGS